MTTFYISDEKLEHQKGLVAEFYFEFSFIIGL